MQKIIFHIGFTLLLSFLVAYGNGQIIKNRIFSNFDSEDNINDSLWSYKGIIFYKCNFGGTASFNFFDFPNLEFDTCSFNDLEMETGAIFQNLTHRNSIIESFSLTEDTIKNEFAFLSSSVTKRANLDATIFENDIYFNDSKFGDLLSFQSCKLNGYIYLRGIYLPDTLNLQDIDLTNLKGEFDLTNFKTKSKPCFINLYGVDIGKLRIRFSGFKLYFPENLMFEEKAYVYQQVLNKLKSDGLFESHKLLDIEFKKLKYENNNQYFINWIDKNWWNYGYNKFLIAINSLFFFFLYFVINFILYDKLLSEGYIIDKFQKMNKELLSKYKKQKFKFFFLKGAYCLIYTSFLFWGLKLDIEKLNIKNIPLFIYIMVQYICGIICLAYVANLILSK